MAERNKRQLLRLSTEAKEKQAKEMKREMKLKQYLDSKQSTNTQFKSSDNVIDKVLVGLLCSLISKDCCHLGDGALCNRFEILSWLNKFRTIP